MEKDEQLGRKGCKKCQGSGYVRSEAPHASGRGKAWAVLCECVETDLLPGQTTIRAKNTLKPS